MKKINLLWFVCMIVITIQGQENESIKPLRIGVKIGAPSVATLSAEYVSPLLDNRVGVTLDYLPINPTFDDVSLQLRNLEVGATIYLNNTGKGLYASASYFNFNTSADVVDVDFDDGTFGSGSTQLEFGTFNVKLGLKTGRTLFLRAELGYAFGNLPNQLVIQSTDGTSFTTEPIEDIPVLGSSGFPIFNFGFGVAFLQERFYLLQ